MGARRVGTTALDLVARAVPRDDRGARAGQRRVLRLRPISDRGLLRRQQADEGLHRLGQYRHQLPALHGVLGRRPCPRLRRGRGAGRVRGLGGSRSRRAGRQQRRLVPSRAASAPARGARRTRDADRGARPAPHRDGRGGRPASAVGTRLRRAVVQRLARASRRFGRARSGMAYAPRSGARRRARGRARGGAPISRRSRPSAASIRRRWRHSTSGSRAPSACSRSIRKA